MGIIKVIGFLALNILVWKVLDALYAFNHEAGFVAAGVFLGVTGTLLCVVALRPPMEGG